MYVFNLTKHLTHSIGTKGSGQLDVSLRLSTSYVSSMTSAQVIDHGELFVLKVTKTEAELHQQPKTPYSPGLLL